MHRQVLRSAAALRHALRKRGGALPQFAMDDDAPPSSVWHRDPCQQGLTFPALGGALPRIGRRRLTAVSTGGIPNTWHLLLMVLTSYSTWQTFDGNDWDVTEFAFSILNFAFNNSTWAEELMAWWNRYVIRFPLYCCIH